MTCSDPFELVLAKSGRTFTVSADDTILDVLERAGFEVPMSCVAGICGTCEIKVLEGVPDHQDTILTDEERAANDTIMICCSRSKTPRLVLDL